MTQTWCNNKLCCINRAQLRWSSCAPRARRNRNVVRDVANFSAARKRVRHRCNQSPREFARRQGNGQGGRSVKGRLRAECVVMRHKKCFEEG